MTTHQFETTIISPSGEVLSAFAYRVDNAWIAGTTVRGKIIEALPAASLARAFDRLRIKLKGEKIASAGGRHRGGAHLRNAAQDSVDKMPEAQMTDALNGHESYARIENVGQIRPGAAYEVSNTDGELVVIVSTRAVSLDEAWVCRRTDGIAGLIVLTSSQLGREVKVPD